MARANINVVNQVGVESVKGTGVPTNRRFPGLDINVGPEIDTKLYRPSGNKFEQVGVRNKFSASGDFDGPLTYGELPYIFASYSNYVAPVQIGATTGYTHTFSPSAFGTDAVKTYTLHRGTTEASGAGESTHVQFNSCTIDISRNDATVKGNVLAQDIVYGQTMTAAPTTVENVPVAMGDMNVFFENTFTTFATKLTDVSGVTIVLPEKYDEKWVLNSTETSWKELVEKGMSPRLKIETEFSTQMQGIFAAMNSDATPTRFVRVGAIGDNIGASADYLFNFDCAVKLLDAKEKAKSDGGVYGFTFDFAIVYDTTFNTTGGAWSLGVVNKVGAL